MKKIKDDLADVLLVVKQRPYAEPREEEYEDAEYILDCLLKNSSGLKVWMMSHGLLDWNDDYVRVDT